MMKKITLLVLLVLSFQNFSAQTINIPDQNLKDALLNYDPAIDTNVDGEIQVSEALAVVQVISGLLSDGIMEVNYYLTVSETKGNMIYLSRTVSKRLYVLVLELGYMV